MPERIGSRFTYDTPLFVLRVETQLARGKLVRLAFPEESNKLLIEARVGQVEMDKRKVKPEELQTLSQALGNALHQTPEEIFQKLAPHLSEDAESLLGRKKGDRYHPHMFPRHRT